MTFVDDYDKLCKKFASDFEKVNSGDKLEEPEFNDDKEPEEDQEQDD